MQASAEMHERRSYPRFELKPAEIEVEVSLESESQFFAGLAGDVSRGGLFVATWRAIPIGARIALSFTLPSGKVQATGTVRWVRKPGDGTSPGVGVAFDDLPAAEAHAVEEFCKSRTPLFVDLDDAL